MSKEQNTEEIKPRAGSNRLPKQPETPFDAPKSDEGVIYDNLPEFEFAIGNAPLEDVEYVEVTQRLFDHLTRKQANRYMTYKGVKVYVAGTKDHNDSIDKMTAEQFYNYEANEKANKLR
jgi:hypothetical protein